MTTENERILMNKVKGLEAENALQLKEIVRLKSLLHRHRRAINSINSIVNDMLDKVKERGPTGIPD